MVYSLYATKASIVTCISASDTVELSPTIMSSDHLRNSSRSSGSTPSMSPMTAIGSGAAMSLTKSHSPCSHTASMSVSHSAPMDRSWTFNALAREAGVDELAAQQMCRIVHVDHHRQARLIGADAACVGEQLGIALRVDHGLVRRRRGQPVAVAEHRLVGPHPPVRFAGRGSIGVESAVGQVHVRLRVVVTASNLLRVAERHLRRCQPNPTSLHASASQAMQVLWRMGDRPAAAAHLPADSAHRR